MTIRDNIVNTWDMVSAIEKDVHGMTYTAFASATASFALYDGFQWIAVIVSIVAGLTAVAVNIHRWIHRNDKPEE